MDVFQERSHIVLSQMAYLYMKGMCTLMKNRASVPDLLRDLTEHRTAEHRTAAGILAWTAEEVLPTSACLTRMTLQSVKKPSHLCIAAETHKQKSFTTNSHLFNIWRWISTKSTLVYFCTASSKTSPTSKRRSVFSLGLRVTIIAAKISTGTVVVQQNDHH